MKKIAVWYTWAGVGHYRAAKAITDGFRLAGYKVDLINPIEVMALSDLFVAKSFAGFHNLTLSLFKWSMLNLKATNNIQEKPGFGGKIIEKVLLQSYKSIQKSAGYHTAHLFPLESYTTLISTHPVATGLGLGVKKSKKLDKLQIINIFPDEATGLTPRFYQHPETLLAVNSSKIARYCLQKMSLNNSEIKLTGHVSDTKLLSARKKIHKRIQTSLKKGQINIGLFIGGFAPISQQNSILEIIKELKIPAEEKKVTLNILTGPHIVFDKKVRTLLKKLNLEKIVKVRNTKNLKQLITVGHKWLLDDINIMFSRPSELVFYSLLTGIPHILFPSLGGQENEMRDLLRKYAKVKDYQTIKPNLVKYLNNKNELTSVSSNLYNNDYPLNGVEKLISLVKN